VGEVPDTDYELPLGVAQVVSTGTDITLVGWGAQMHQLHRAAKMAAKDGISCEVIDLCTLLPWDSDTVAKSVIKTGRLIISHEAPRTGGFAGEIAATMQERCFLSLESPITRITGLDTPFPLVFEKEYLPDYLKVFEAIKASVHF
ncbi:MAG: alpha-ketoacid dehydrogenase subunit beta, partial [Porticoccaceae bacterium]|nr:alpha-ketoacid dehydrogenase subunit beta [Porticoccaceae bacterium]